MTALLHVTDGTTTVNLLKASKRTGFHLANWRPAVAQFKDDGIWQNSPLSDGRRLADYRWDNVVETFEVVLDGHDQDGLARELQNLQRLLVQASDYWKANWACLPVYLAARADCETNTRYALLYRGGLPELDNPHAQPFFSRHATMRDLTVVVERGPWLETAPGTGTAVAISNPGRAATTNSGEVFVANKHNTAALTHIFVNDGGVFGANQVAATAFNLLPAVPVDGDVVYFGIAAADVTPFCSLVFDIGVAETGISDIDWEYWNGGWTALIVQDNTDHDGVMDQNAFNTTGVKSVHWEQPADWARTAINGVTATWVRANVPAAGIPGAATAPTQQNRIVYTVLWPYVELATAQAPGDIPALARLRQWNQAGRDDGGASVSLYDAAVICGLRSLSRGSNFTPYLNLCDEQNHASITVDITGAAACTYANLATTATGRAVLFTAGTDDTFTVTIGAALAQEYLGRYHAYLRADVGAGLTAGTFRLGVTFGSATTYTETVSRTAGVQTDIIDLGFVSLLPSGINPANDVAGIVLTVDFTADANIYFYDLILMPIDEWACLATASGEADVVFRYSAAYPRILDIDAVDFPKVMQRAITREADETVVRSWALVGNGSPILQANAAQRLWYVVTQVSTSYIGAVNSVEVKRQSRYLGLRGNR